MYLITVPNIDVLRERIQNGFDQIRNTPDFYREKGKAWNAGSGDASK